MIMKMIIIFQLKGIPASEALILIVMTWSENEQFDETHLQEGLHQEYVLEVAPKS